MKRKGLSPADHVVLGNLLKQARNALLSAAVLARPYGRLSQQLGETADDLNTPCDFLEKRLIEQVGDGMVEGVPVREVYFGPVMEELEDAQ
jgi:hypothetical protein